METTSNFATFFHVKSSDFRFVTWFMSVLKFGLPRPSFKVFRTKNWVTLSHFSLFLSKYDQLRRDTTWPKWRCYLNGAFLKLCFRTRSWHYVICNVHCAKLVLLKVSIISKLVHHLKVSIILKLVLTKLELSVSKTLVLLKVSIIFQETLF